MIAWLKKFYTEAKTKLTTYLAALTALVAEIPNMVSTDVLNQIHSVVNPQTYKHIIAVLAVSTIWSRIRRSLNGSV